MHKKKTLKLDQNMFWNSDIVRFILVCLFVGITGIFVYLFFTDELKYIGHETTSIRAKIISERRYHVGHGLYVQTGKCDFVYEQKKYTVRFKTKNYRAIGNKKEFEIGDIITLKISKKNPTITKFLY
ncbi:hypothetical protein [Tenacibaculum xiamenense]|uniref:hypothetical protein n=1 Tax=Tenacibaculum xiamenense TaxID=1261553 RepID=UPI003893C27A